MAHGVTLPLHIAIIRMSEQHSKLNYPKEKIDTKDCAQKLFKFGQNTGSVLYSIISPYEKTYPVTPSSWQSFPNSALELRNWPSFTWTSNIDFIQYQQSNVSTFPSEPHRIATAKIQSKSENACSQGS